LELVALRGEKEQLDDEVANLDRARAELLANIGKAELELETAREDFQRTQSELAGAQQKLSGTEAELAGAQVSLSTAEEQRTVVEASTAGLRGFPFTSAYTAAKHGMVGLARALHAELRSARIHVYAVCPGFVDSDITQQAAAAIAARGKTTVDEAMARMAGQNRIGRMHTPAEVAAAVGRLLRDRPEGCVYDLDRDPPAFVDGPSP
jgi:NAD(P)-dependent dehydrogenase (short-subunit alcohol dehydrogenase family)